MNKRLIATIATCGMKEKDIAKRIGVYPSRLSEHLTGKYPLSDHKKEQLAKLLRKTTEWLWGKPSNEK